MKKMMVGALAIVAAFAVNAGAVNWSIEGVKTSDGQSDANGYLVYFMVDSGAGFTGGTAFTRAEALTAIENSDLSFLDDNAVLGMWGGPATVDGGSAFDSGVGDGFFTDNSTDVKSYLVILNADTVDNATKAFVTDLAETPIPLGEGNPAFDVSGTADSTAWTTIGNAPEPTSGLLLLIGMAGLALKRKRA